MCSWQDCSMRPAGGSSSPGKFLYPAQIVLLAHSVGEEAVARGGRQGFMEGGVDAEPLVGAGAAATGGVHPLVGVADRRGSGAPLRPAHCTSMRNS